MMYLLPTNMDFVSWSSQLHNSLRGFIFPNPFPVEKWWDWVSALKQLNPKANIPIARKDAYPHIEDWRKWAKFFLNNINAG